MTSLAGKTLSHYRIREELSRGGMGIVYRAEDLRLNREVALKVLPPELVQDPDRRRRLVHEARSAAMLDHPHIAVVYEIDEAEGVTFIAMELIRGEKLSELLNTRRLELDEVLTLATEVAEGLARAHAKGIIHRDLKPSNVMVTEEGHAKIIDFGVAKAAARPLLGDLTDAATSGLAESATDPGVVMGTAPYMSPEQAGGETVDHRSDVFSFGILLHEMLTGRPPFRGTTTIDVLHAILHDPAPPVGPVRPEEARADLQRILDKCLAKDPGSRYQGFADLIVDLRSARRAIDSAPHLTVARPSLHGPALQDRKRVLLAAALVAVVAGGVFAYRHVTRRPDGPRAKPSVAVLLFHNLRGDPALEWLRTGLAEMLVTDLAQSPQLEVVGTDLVHRALKDLKQLDEAVLSPETVQEVGRRVGASTLLVGNFVKAGETIRIHVKVQNVGTDRVSGSEKVEGNGEGSLFALVDELTQRVKARLNVPLEARTFLERDLKDVTTASVDAYRNYVEGMRLHLQQKEQESIPLLEKAVAGDPAFAMAHARLWAVHMNLGHPQEAEAHAARALEHADRLSARDRYYVEGNYYSLREETLGRAIQAYAKAVELYPDHAPPRHNLARRYQILEQYPEAILHFEELRRQGSTFPFSYGSLAECYAALGEFEKGRDALQDLLQRTPDNASGLAYLGLHFARWGRFDEALDAFQKADALGPGQVTTALGRWEVHVLRDQWAAAADAVRPLTAANDPFARWEGFRALATLALHRGRGREAIGLLEQAARAYAEPGRYSALARDEAAHVLLERGDAAGALDQAERAEREGPGDRAAWTGLFYGALAKDRLGRTAEADRSAKELQEVADALPSTREKRRARHLAGERLLRGGQPAAAIDPLRGAQASLPTRGFPGIHAPLWYTLASAELADGNPKGAAAWLQRVVDSTTERTRWPIPYARSLFLLAQIHERAGEGAKARPLYSRFVDLWKNGDLDRERVTEAAARLR